MFYDSNTFKLDAIFCLALIFITVLPTISFAQNEAEKHTTFINMEFTQSDIQNKLTATLTARIKGERGRKKVDSAEIEFYNVSDTSEIFLGKAQTDIDGVATLQLSKDQKLSSNEDGEFTYRSLFNGNGNFTDVSKDLSIKEVNMDVSFIEIDSVKTIVTSAYQIDESGHKIPVEEDVNFYVPRQFSMLKIGEVELNGGKGTIEFPITLPGDSIGNLQIIAKIESSKDYGNVEAIAIKDWGKARPAIIVEERRGLGDTDAPLWMVYTLIVLLSAVWFHYIYIMYVFIAIKRKGKKASLV